MKINIIFDTKKINPKTGAFRTKVIIDDEFEENGFVMAHKDLVKIIEELGCRIEDLVRINQLRKMNENVDDVRNFVKTYKENAEL